MSTAAQDQPRRGHQVDALDGFYESIDHYQFIDARTDWLLLFDCEPREPVESDGDRAGFSPAFERFDVGRDWPAEDARNWMAVGFRAHDDVPQPASKTWAGGLALFGVGVAALVAGIVFAPRSTTPPAAHAPASLEPQSRASVATGARPDVTTPALAPALPAPTPAMVVQTPVPPARAPSPPSPAPAIGAPAARVAANPAGPVATTGSTDVPTIVVPAVEAPPVSSPSPVVALAAAISETPAPATPAPTPAVPPTAVAAPPVAVAAVAAVPAVVPVREVETRAIQTVLGRYRDAFNTLDARGAFAVWPGVNERDLARAFERIEEQHLSFDQCRIEVGGAMAEAACTGTARFVPRVGNRTGKAEAREWRFTFRKAASGWVIDRVRAR